MIESGLWRQIFTVSNTLDGVESTVCEENWQCWNSDYVKKRYSLILLMAHRRAAALTSCRDGDKHDKAKRKWTYHKLTRTDTHIQKDSLEHSDPCVHALPSQFESLCLCCFVHPPPASLSFCRSRLFLVVCTDSWGIIAELGCAWQTWEARNEGEELEVWRERLLIHSSLLCDSGVMVGAGTARPERNVPYRYRPATTQWPHCS